MRTEKEMIALLLETAKADERIRAVYMNGSRTNPNVPKDIYQDYDVVFVVTETGSFLADKNWVMKFGNPLIIQEPDWNDVQTGLSDHVFDYSRRYAWLMLFDDGNRIDLGIEIPDEAIHNILKDKLTMLLLDKDGLLPKISPPTDIDYHVEKPTDGQFNACCNEFWWCLNNVAKGIAREELPYAMSMLNEVVRKMLDRLIEWYIGINNDFSVSTGKMGKYFKNYLPDEIYRRYCDTFPRGKIDEIWQSVFIMCDLFHELAQPVSEHFGFTYRQNEEDGMRAYMNKVKNNAYKCNCIG